MRISLCVVAVAIAVVMGLASAPSRAEDQTPDKVAPVVPLQVNAFDLQDVRLLDGPFKHAMELDQAYLLSLDVDRLLHNFRVNAGLPSAAKPLGGWEKPDCELRGHFVGHYLSACAMMYASTGDSRFKDRCDTIVAALAQCQDKLGGGYLSAFPENYFDRLEARKQVWAPYYTLHKILAGLLDSYLHCQNTQALESCEKLADWVIVRNSPFSDQQMQLLLGTEQGGMNEVLANLYAVTGKERYLKIALRFNHHAVIDPASQQRDTLTGLHANTQIPKFIGAAREYELTGREPLKTAALFFWQTVVNERSYVIGGNSNNEMFTAKEKLSGALGPRTTETCNTYNMLKLTRHLFCWDPQARYADYYERALYNHILASQNPQTGMMCYYVPLRAGEEKKYSLPNDSFWCCTGTGVENHAKYGDSIYFYGPNDLYVNLFIASELTWKQGGVVVRQETRFPDEAATRLVFTCDGPRRVALHLRHPAWAVGAFEIRLNGQLQDIPSTAGSYAILDRTWNSGDVVDVAMPFSPHVEGFADNPDRFAILNGPLVLCAQVASAQAVPALLVPRDQFAASLKAVEGKPSTFTADPGTVSGGKLTLEPFYKMQGDRRYVVYLDALSPAAGAARAAADAAAAVAGPVRDYPVKPVPFTAVHLTDAFWQPKLEINRTVTIPYVFQQCERTGRVGNFERAAAALAGRDVPNKKPPGYPFDDTDVYKTIEGAAYTLRVHPDAALDAYLDVLIAKIAAAQEPDGYLYTTRTIDPAHPHTWSGHERWINEQVLSHELYDLGHLYEAATAHYQATGKRSFLNVAIKSADLLDKTFGPGKRSVFPGHQVVEMGLVCMYRATGEERYLKLAKFFLDQRGPNGTAGSGSRYNQSHLKVVDQTEAVGHAVRAMYMYSGMADVAALTGDESYLKAIDAIWRDVAGKKLYITGGVGSQGNGEAFGPAYDLPNMTAYNETCAAIGNVFWNQRMFLLHADARYVDVAERTLYNGLISGVSLDGKRFFYPNPLESKGQHSRSPWFDCACCIGNITRFMPSVPGYFYAEEGDALYVNLFAASESDIKLDDGRSIHVVQETHYPWDGKVKLTITPDKPGRFTVNVRIPGWARNQPVDSELYRFADLTDEPATLAVNDKPVSMELSKGYAALSRDWRAGDVVELNLPMPVRRVIANDHVKADSGRVALERGPIVYCAEWPDNPGGDVRNLELTDSAALAHEYRPGLLDGVTVVTGTADMISRGGDGQLHHTPQPFTAIPYYAWANRGRGEMTVWLAHTDAAALARAAATIASQSRVSTSGGTGIEAINDQEEPASSGDESHGFFHWWPRKGTVEWVQYTWAEPAAVSSSEVYWFDDTGRGECRVPRSWRIVYKDGPEWKPVAASGAYGVARDRYNRVEFTPVTTSALRMEVTLQPNWSAGIHEWRVGADAHK